MSRHRLLTVVFTLAAIAAPSLVYAQKLVFVVRHAERADGGTGTGGMAGAPADPPLSKAGEARAAKLATMLADAGIKAIFATEFKRTQDTGKPLAAKLGLTVQSIKSADAAALTAALKQHPSDVVLVVAHSNTMPAIIKALGGPVVTIGDDDYDNLFIVVPSTGAMTRIHF